jgi:peptide deformylase
MLKKVITFRDAESAILFQQTQKVNRFDRSLRCLAEKMSEIMRKADGLGLAGPQVNSNLAICLVIRGDKTIALCNPKIVDCSEEKVTMEEGCLSFPDIFLRITRPRAIKVEYQDLKGKKKKLEAGGIFARTVQHEIDHLEGVVFTARADSK